MTFLTLWLCVFVKLCIFIFVSTVAGGAVCICPISIIQGLPDPPPATMWGSTNPLLPSEQ